MTKRMLIDATHAEETRVAVVDDGRLEEFDYESAFRKPLKGNIYLAKVTRVEPSLQAAFVNFGGNRHGFLPFSEIHPDYFRIPVADREALMAEQEEALRAAEEEEAALEEEDARRAAEEDKVEQPSDSEEGSVEEIEDDKEAIEEIGGEEESEDQKADDAEDAADESADAEKDEKPKKGRGRGRGGKAKPKSKALAMESDPDDVKVSDVLPEGEDDEINGNVRAPDEDDEIDEEADAVGNIAPEEDDVDGNNTQNGQRHRRDRGDRGDRGGRGRRGRRGRGGRNGGGRNGGGRSGGDHQRSERVGGGEVDHEQRFRFNLRRKYKIQEVIKRGQIMLVQVSKEERGNKGAAVGSYLSLPGRYCVLMPNSPRAGGVSRKIANYKDRARMREIMKDLEVPKGMSVILRTAGVSRTKVEIKRDLDYLMKLWDNIRELTLESTAPALVYEEADLVKRAVRDLYSRDIEEIHVAGKEGYETAKNFMKMLMPSHVKKVIEYKNDNVPLFNHYKIEKQIAEIGETQVTLPSGGYLVINPTEALVSIDVNSGKATKERHIEETALRTNMEAAEEVARQLRLRDLGGLVVIDFIDMEDRRNNAKVERKMREALSGDRARIQMGRISSFGLMELSRQRLSPSLTESQFELCEHCHGVGRVRTADAASIMVLRAIEDEGMKGRAAQVIAHVPSAVALYILNNKRANLADIEERHKLSVVVRVDEGLGASGFRVEVSKPASKDDDDEPDPQENEDAGADDEESASGKGDNDERSSRRRRGRRGGRRRGGRDRGNAESADADQDDSFEQDDADAEDQAQDQAAEEKADKPEKSGKRGGRKPSKKKEDAPQSSEEPVSEAKPEAKPLEAEPVAEVKAVRPSNDDKPAKAEAAPKDYEKVNEAPEQKKKGWWNKLVD